ncbi:hypothetical protein BDZ45DRAFT_753702 [Acephala macrosclerotiorum]|nr:hypothetical protein BDZ45DRAFT_753702 [Acephala macrosclerotiorum]
MPNTQQTPSCDHEANQVGKSSGLPEILLTLANGNVLLVVPVFLVGIFRYTTLNVLIQYASLRFGIKISTGATFYTETAIKHAVRPQSIDLFLVRMSVTLMCIRCLAIGFAQSGFAQSSLLLPIDDTKATFFAAIVVFESVGHAVGDSAMQQIFAHSLRLTEFWWALLFFVGAGLYFCAATSSAFIRIDTKEGNVQDIEGLSDHDD